MTPDDIHAALMTRDPRAKCLATRALYAADPGALAASSGVAEDIPVPGRPERPTLVHPSKLARRGLGTDYGRAALIHAIAHIEFNAINLGLDAAYRYRGMPATYYADWLSMAADESRHFEMLNARLADFGYAYGDFDAHNGLWEMAAKTAHDPMVRMALVPRVLEARGLDVTPAMIDKLKSVGDDKTVAIFEQILKEEVPHVEIGTRWFRYFAEPRGLDPDKTFFKLLDEYMNGGPPGPYNMDARRQARFSEPELQELGARDKRRT
ncbi:ferritin-like domain-containing protein [Salinisphaera sp.]|uniref:ferritin-like domain-containing protein n=1 Tax=Salinisphaera sp. TaxID=1914330 RepID=UPI002D791A8A|nr:ferritin-like domain-containing protein [Salinisphaera sp.]HET7314387.1 ferritin-like domain-containing protein [Salinisphaera sp.]